MEIIFLLIPLSLVLVGGIVWAFFWAVRSGQFDDLEGPAHRILMDDDDVPRKQPEVEKNWEKTGETGDKVKSKK
jgi:cbb3-type cytochrome oxidase maturation protein